MSHETSTRRRFFLGAGTAVSAPVAFAASASADDSDLRDRLHAFEDGLALRRLAQQLARDSDVRVRAGIAPQFVAMRIDDIERDMRFTTDAGRHGSNRSNRATLYINCTVWRDEAIDAPDSALLDMARQQGEGFVRHEHGARVKVQCSRDAQMQWRIDSAQIKES